MILTTKGRQQYKFDNVSIVDPSKQQSGCDYGNYC